MKKNKIKYQKSVINGGGGRYLYQKEYMIPKIIHYCWFGRKPYPEVVNKCIESWKKYLPEYEIKLWNEDTFNVNSHPFVREMYENELYAFVSDYVRVWALYNYGGIYMDSDVEILKPFTDEMLDKPYMLGMMDDFFIASYVMGFEKNDGNINLLFEIYDKVVKEPIIMETRITCILDKSSLSIYPSYYFTPMKNDEYEHAYTKHHFQSSFTKKYKEYIKNNKL